MGFLSRLNGRITEAALAGTGGSFAVMAAATGAALAATAYSFNLHPEGMAFLIPATLAAAIAGTGFSRIWTLRRETGSAVVHCCDDLAEAMDCLIIGCDLSGAVLSVSSNCEALLGLPPGQVMGRGFFDRVHVADRPAFMKTVSDAGAACAAVATTLRWRGPWLGREDYAEPAFLWLEMRARRAANYARPTGGRQEAKVVAIFRHVTSAQTREATDGNASKAAGPNHSNKYFLAHVSHELREPLTAITGFSELLADPQLVPPEPDKQREYARIIHQSGRHLIAVVDSILDAPINEPGSLPVDVERLAVSPLIDLCCDMVKLQADRCGVELLRAYPKNLEEMFGNRRLFTQILLNLISNAIKFTPPAGSVTISARIEADSLLILVTDTGIGISAKDLGHLGDPFFQSASAPQWHDKGIGLGLSIVRGFVGLLGGAMTVASEPGKGTCVRVRLPLDCRNPVVKAGVSAKIETKTRLPATATSDLDKPKMVKKIA